MLRALLADPFLIEAAAAAQPSQQLLQLKYAALKNLGAAREAAQDAAAAPDALSAYCAAAALDGGDVVLWRAPSRPFVTPNRSHALRRRRLATVAVELRRLPLARLALEAGLGLNAQHPALLSELAEVCLALGDSGGAEAAAREMLLLAPAHPRSLQLRRAHIT